MQHSVHIRAGVCVSWTFYWDQNKSNTIFPIRLFLCKRDRCRSESSAGIVRPQQWTQTLVQIPVHLRLWRFVSWSRIWRFLVNFIWKPSNVSSDLADCLCCSFLLYHAGVWLGIFSLQRGRLKSFVIRHLFSWYYQLFLF